MHVVQWHITDVWSVFLPHILYVHYHIFVIFVNKTAVPSPPMSVRVLSVSENEVTLSWLISSDDLTPIIAIEVNVFPAAGAPFRRVHSSVNTTTITGLMLFRDYQISIAAVTCAFPSEVVNIIARTLSLSMLARWQKSSILNCMIDQA